MSNFLDELRDDIGSLGLVDGWSSNLQNVRECQETLDSLGENARRMLEIGIVQDELVKLGFEVNRSLYPYEYWRNEYFVHFLHESVIVGKKVNEDYPDWGAFCYASPTWQEDLINRVKELIK